MAGVYALDYIRKEPEEVTLMGSSTGPLTLDASGGPLHLGLRIEDQHQCWPVAYDTLILAKEACG